MQFRYFLFFSLLALHGQGISLYAASPLRGASAYEKDVLPVLQEYCYDCHADGVDKGNFLLDKHADFAALVGDKKLWDNVREHVTTHVMPPENKAQPTNEQRDAIVRWIEDDVFWVDATKPDPGHVTLRRLNRAEYNNTVRDIFRVDTRPAQNFPPDDTGYGFDNIGDVLSLSPLLMEKYMRAARKIAEDAVWVKAPDRADEERYADEFTISEGKGAAQSGVLTLFSNGDITTKVSPKEDGVYQLSFMLGAKQAGPEKAKYAILVDGTEVQQGEIKDEKSPTDPGGNWERIALEVPMKKGGRKVSVRFLNDYSDANASDPQQRDRNLLFHSMQFVEPVRFRTPYQTKFLDWLFDGKRLPAPQMLLLGTDFADASGATSFYDGMAGMAGNGTIKRNIDIYEAGDYSIRLSVSANQAGNENAKVTVKVGGEDAGTFEITTKHDKQQWLYFRKALTPGKIPVEISFINDYYEKPGVDRNASVHKVLIEGPYSKSIPVTGKSAPPWIAKIGQRVMRRPMDQSDLDKLTKLAEMARAEGASSVETIAVICEALLCSPKFLFRGGADPTGAPANGSVLVDEYSLASRLSYFLWSSCPDDELMKLAQEGKLRENLPAQVKRMIGDWKAYAMADNFAGQWLRLRDIDLVAPNRRLYPEFQGGISGEMKKESQLYFDHIFRNNLSALEFLDSDYTFLNEKLAKFYDIKDVKGKEFRKVSLAGTPRGGILTHGSILTITSHPNRTSPVNRGKFLLENIIGTPPPPAPQDVPAFKEDRGAKVTGTLRQRFEAHRANPSCASCHAFLDPMGFAFENFDAIGRFRNKDNGQPIDATGKLLTGQTFDNAQQLRKLLVDVKKDDFIRCLVENMLIYSLGRGLDYPDKLFVKEITKQAAADGYKFQDIVLAVINSVPFQKMRAK